MTQAIEAVDLERLNEAEREALELLAQGHTAKSIAALTGRSVGAVNERLREARRKTGVGSSRELARLLSAQKIRDEEIGVAAAAAPEAANGAEAAPEMARRWRRKGATVMAVLAIGGLAAAMLLQPEPQVVEEQVVEEKPSQASDAKPVPEDPLLGSHYLRPPEADPNHLYPLVRSQARDPDWAPRMEAALREHHEKIPGIGKPDNELRVICATTVCEVAGTLPASKDERLRTAMKTLQGKPADELGRKLGLEMKTVGFSNNGKTPPQGVFVAYWMKVES